MMVILSQQNNPERLKAILQGYIADKFQIFHMLVQWFFFLNHATLNIISAIITPRKNSFQSKNPLKTPTF